MVSILEVGGGEKEIYLHVYATDLCIHELEHNFKLSVFYTFPLVFSTLVCLLRRNSFHPPAFPFIMFMYALWVYFIFYIYVRHTVTDSCSCFQRIHINLLPLEK